ncbi:hypothetical protein [Bradyrhizobium betae]|uniref:Uncharacterized protein n=1 Tax=Bradyrhizobium betae TaxID=244734 RepID=A0A5P6P0S8_9BRAD|nr:hypothetical protein [Bradyrhizobium betae]MCS3731706.1 hypothetical protein [Bradyrhizobium betae]QFI71698.1 hypothetical protein F8237_04510 [Bradyrhizobium betae]
MKSATLLALGFVVGGVWSLDGARGQTPATPPVSLAPPKASPQAGARNSPAPSDRASSTPATSGLPAAPTSAVDYDGLSVDNAEAGDAPNQSTRPMGSRTQPNLDKKGAASQQLIDQEDEALKRKLTICQSCK